MKNPKCFICKKQIFSHSQLTISNRSFGYRQLSKILSLHNSCASTYKKNRKKNIFGLFKNNDTIISTKELRKHMALNLFLAIIFLLLIVYNFIFLFNNNVPMMIVIIYNLLPVILLIWFLKELIIITKINNLK